MNEGVTKFISMHRKHSLYYDPQTKKRFVELDTWRHRMFLADVIGCDLSRYGACYGNVSTRVSPERAAASGYRSFLISGTQTGNLKHLDLDHYARVYRYDHAQNKVWSEGLREPSSESMTHGAIYDLSMEINVVFHIHSSDLWNKAAKLRIPVSNPQIEYGTPEMASEVLRLYKTENLAETKIFSMGGHQDGIIAFGQNAQEAGSLLLGYLARSK